MEPARSETTSGAALRFALGMAQMFLAGSAMVLLFATGVTALTIAATCAATALTLTSRWLFRRQQRS